MLPLWSPAIPTMANPMLQALSHSSCSVSLPSLSKFTISKNQKRTRIIGGPLILCCSGSTSVKSSPPVITTSTASPPKRKRHRYRKQYPGESKGITEEMRFVAMKLRNVNGKYTHKIKTGRNDAQGSLCDDDEREAKEEAEAGGNSISSDDDGGDGGGSWKPSMEGFLKYLVDSRLVFKTVERIVDESRDVSYAYFRKTGLERSDGLSKDLEWFSQLDIVIPQPSNLGVSYAKYLEELAEKSAPLFLCHFYNIYFSHIAGGQVIARQVSDKLLEGRELEFYRWEGNVQELLKVVREKLNMVGEVTA